MRRGGSRARLDVADPGRAPAYVTAHGLGPSPVCPSLRRRRARSSAAGARVRSGLRGAWEDSTARPPAPSPAGPTTSVVSELSAEPEPSASQPTTPAAPPPVKPPSWASFGQPRLVASYFEKGKIGPLVLEASGVHRGALICKVTAASGGWDQAMPFVGTGVETLPDLRVWIGDKTGTILGNTLQGYVFLREIDLRPGTPVRVRLEDVDVTSSSREPSIRRRAASSQAHGASPLQGHGAREASGTTSPRVPRRLFDVHPRREHARVDVVSQGDGASVSGTGRGRGGVRGSSWRVTQAAGSQRRASA
jgi:hypothetical protein